MSKIINLHSADVRHSKEESVLVLLELCKDLARHARHVTHCAMPLVRKTDIIDRIVGLSEAVVATSREYMRDENQRESACRPRASK